MHFQIIFNHNVHIRQKYKFWKGHSIYKFYRKVQFINITKTCGISDLYMIISWIYIILTSDFFRRSLSFLSFPCINDLANISFVIDGYKVIMSKFLGIYLNLLHLSSINAPSKPTDYSLQNKYKHCQSQVKWKMTQQHKH